VGKEGRETKEFIAKGKRGYAEGGHPSTWALHEKQKDGTQAERPN